MDGNFRRVFSYVAYLTHILYIYICLEQNITVIKSIIFGECTENVMFSMALNLLAFTTGATFYMQMCVCEFSPCSPVKIYLYNVKVMCPNNLEQILTTSIE